MRSVLFRTVFLSAVLALFPLVAFSATENAQPGATQAGRSAAKAEYFTVTIGNKSIQLKVPEDFVECTREDSPSYFDHLENVKADNAQILSVFIPPCELKKLRDDGEYDPAVRFVFTTYPEFADEEIDRLAFAVARIGWSYSVIELKEEYPGIAQRIPSKIYEDETIFSLGITYSLEPTDLEIGDAVVGTEMLVEGKLLTLHVVKRVESDVDLLLLKNLTLRYLGR